MSTVKENDNRSPIKTIFDKFAKHKDVELVYGEPITHGKQCIIPVAEISYSFGFGSGKESSEETDEVTISEQGEGGGGHISVKPLGVYKMSESGSRVRFIPTFDVKYFLKFFSVFTLGLVFLLRKK